MHQDRVRRRTMTVIYSGQHYHLTDDAVTVGAPGETPRIVEIDTLPLPVARTLQSFRAAGGGARA